MIFFGCHSQLSGLILLVTMLPSLILKKKKVIPVQVRQCICFNFILSTNTHYIVGFYEENKSFIHTFFHRNSFDVDLARALFAPNTALHPTLLQGTQTSTLTTDLNYQQPEATVSSPAAASRNSNHRFVLNDSDEDSNENSDK